MVPTRKSRKFPGLMIPLQLERAASPQLIPRREPPHTSPTAPACPTPRIPPASEAAPSSSALSRRPQLSQDHRLLRSQARYPRFPSATECPRFLSAAECPRFPSAAECPRFPSAAECPRFPSALQCLLRDSALQCLLPDSALQCLLRDCALQCRSRPALQSPCRSAPPVLCRGCCVGGGGNFCV